MISYRLKSMWFDPGAVRRRPGIIYQGDDKIEDQLPSGTEVLNDKNEVVRVVERKKAETEKVVEVQVKTDTDATVTTTPAKTVKL